MLLNTSSHKTFVWMKTSFIFVFRRCLQDVFKTSIFALVIRLQKTSSRRLHDVFKTSSRPLAKTSSRHLQDVFKTSSRPLAKKSSRRFQDISSSQTAVVNKSSRSIAKTVTYRKIYLGHTSKKFMVSVQNLQE